MDAPQNNPEKSISEQLREALDALTPNQLRFVVALDLYKTKGEAAEAIGLKPDTVYRWNGNVERAHRLIQLDREEAARQVSRGALVKAMMVKVNALDSDDEAIRQKAATEIIEQNLGKATQRSEIGGIGGGPVELKVVENIVTSRRNPDGSASGASEIP